MSSAGIWQDELEEKEQEEEEGMKYMKLLLGNTIPTFSRSCLTSVSRRCLLLWKGWASSASKLASPAPGRGREREGEREREEGRRGKEARVVNYTQLLLDHTHLAQ